MSAARFWSGRARCRRNSRNAREISKNSGTSSRNASWPRSVSISANDTRAPLALSACTMARDSEVGNSQSDGERHHAEPGLDAAKRFRQHAIMVGGDVEIVHRPGQIEIAVGIEPLDKGRALIAQIAFDLEIRVERKCRQLAVLHPPSELAMQCGVRKIGDMRGHPRHAEPAMRIGACFEIAAVDASPDRPSRPGGRVHGTRCSAPNAGCCRPPPAPRTPAWDRPRSIAAPACRPSSRRPRRTACRCRGDRSAWSARAPCREW